MHNPQAETRFVELMTELFQLDEAQALDFGIYRVIRRHNQEVRAFLGEIITKGEAKQLHGGTLATLLEKAFTATDHELIEEAKERKANLESQLGLNTKQSQDEREAILTGQSNIPALKKLVQEYRDTLATLEAQHTGGSDRTEVLNHLYNFFARHYQDGDFIVERRFSKNGSRYIQSRGEDTEFHWATEDMYYIKSGDTFTDYPVTLTNGEKILFSVEPDTLNTTRANLKPTDKAHYEVHAVEKQQDGSHKLVLSYLKGAQSDKQKNDIAAALCKQIKADEAEVKRWLNHFIARNQSDFFIHKKLKDALTGDLDIFIKTEVLSTDQLLELNDLPRRAINVGRIVKHMGLQIIDFLATLEDFQKQLWEKKKLVFTTRYVITLDRIARLAGEKWLEEQLPNILKSQNDEWQALGLGEFKKAQDCKDITPGDLASEAKTRWLPLPVDTGLLAEDFKWVLLEAVTQSAPLDDSLDGVAIHSDNWQALNTLQEKYREQVKCVYIDPPYNTNASGIPYKNGYRHASWGALMENRIEKLYDCMSQDGAIFVSIDKVERTQLEQVLDKTYGVDNKVEELIWVQNTNDGRAPTYSTNHEYVEVYAKSKAAVEADYGMFREPKPGYEEVMAIVQELNPKYPSISQIENAIRALYARHKAELKEECEALNLDWEVEKRNDAWKGIYNYNRAEYRTDDGKYVEEKNARKRSAAIWIYRESDWTIMSSESKQSGTTRDPKDPNYRYYEPIHPVTGNPVRMSTRGWKGTQFIDPENPDRNSWESLNNDHRIAWGPDEHKVPQQKRFLHEVESNVSKSVFTDYSDGEKQTTAMFGKAGVFLAPKHTNFVGRFVTQGAKPDSYVLDCFGGSGSTAHAVMEVNRIEKTRRKFITAEVNRYFETLIIPRLKKAGAAHKWQSGKAKACDGPGLFMRIQALEQYEDTLENLDAENSQQNTLAFEDPAFSLRYRMNRQSKAVYCAIDSYRSPWGYQLKRALGGGEAPSQPVDLVESLIYLLGLKVNQLYREDEGVVITGQNRRSQTVAVFFRVCDHANSEAWIAAKLAAHDAQRLYTNLPAELGCEGSDRLNAIEAVFASQFGRGDL